MATFLRQSSFSTVLLLSQRYVLTECYIFKRKYQKFSKIKWVQVDWLLLLPLGQKGLEMPHRTEENFLFTPCCFCDSLAPRAWSIFTMWEGLSQVLPFISSTTFPPSLPTKPSIYILSYFLSSVHCFLVLWHLGMWSHWLSLDLWLTLLPFWVRPAV